MKVAGGLLMSRKARLVVGKAAGPGFLIVSEADGKLAMMWPQVPPGQKPNASTAQRQPDRARPKNRPNQRGCRLFPGSNSQDWLVSYKPRKGGKRARTT